MKTSQARCQCRSDGSQCFPQRAKAEETSAFVRILDAKCRLIDEASRIHVRQMQNPGIGANVAKPQLDSCKAHVLSRTLICIRATAIMFSARATRCVKYPFGIRVQHACAIGHHLSGPGIALLIVDMINRFDSTVAMHCNSAHSFKIAAMIHRLRDCFDAAQRPGIHNDDSCRRQLAASASMHRENIRISRQCRPITRSGRPAP